VCGPDLIWTCQIVLEDSQSIEKVQFPNELNQQGLSSYKTQYARIKKSSDQPSWRRENDSRNLSLFSMSHGPKPDPALQ